MSMLTIVKLQSALWKEEYEYRPNNSETNLKNELQKLFDETKGWDFSINLMGKFTSNNTFEVTPKWQFATFSGTERKISYLNGEVRQDNFGKHYLFFTVRTNVFFLIATIGFPIIGCLAWLFDDTQNDKQETLFVSLSFIIIVPLILFPIGYLAKKSLKNRFVKALNLQSIN